MDDIFKAIDNIVKAIVANPYVGLIGFVVAIVSLIYAYYVGQRDRKIKHLYYSLVSTSVIADRKTIFPKLEISYNGKQLDNLTVTKIRMKNIGTEVLRPNDIANNDPIKFSVVSDGAILLDFGLSYTSDLNNNFAISQIDEQVMEVKFDYIEPGDMANFEILHTGKDSQAVVVSGTVVGAYRPFTTHRVQDFSEFTSPMERALVFMLNNPRNFVILVTLSVAFVFGLLSYLFFPINLILSSLCIVPCIMFAVLFVRFLARRHDPQRDTLTRDMMVSIFARIAPRMSAEHQFKESDEAH